LPISVMRGHDVQNRRIQVESLSGGDDPKICVCALLAKDARGLFIQQFPGRQTRPDQQRAQRIRPRPFHPFGEEQVRMMIDPLPLIEKSLARKPQPAIQPNPRPRTVAHLGVPVHQMDRRMRRQCKPPEKYLLWN